MTKPLLALATVMAFLTFLDGSVAFADSREASRIETATEVLKEISAIPEKAIPPSLLRNAYGVAVIPGVIKAGFIVGVRAGRGILAVRNEKNRWSNPAFLTLRGGSVGYQIGAQSIDIVLVFKSKKNIDALMKGKFTLGGDASIAAGPVGRRAEAGTDIQLKSEIYSYSRSRGLFAGVSLEGAALQFDDDANAHFYGSPGITPKRILTDETLKVPEAANNFRRTLMNYIRMAGEK